MIVEITKMSACGNDFIIIDDRANTLSLQPEKIARRLCSRRLSVGADGLLLIKKSTKADVKIVYLNQDGSHAALCLNGTRCAARFSCTRVLAPRKMKIETEAGILSARILSNGVAVDLPTSPRSITPLSFNLADETFSGHFVDVGVPHLIIHYQGDLSQVDFVPIARILRHHPSLPEGGANVSFIFLEDEHLVRMRTYERGIEDEVLSCSSGSMAALFALYNRGLKIRSPLQILPPSLIPLNFDFERDEKGFTTLTLTGEARFIFTTTVEDEAWTWGA